MAILDDIKTLQNVEITDTSKDGLFSIYIRKAVTLIANYLNIPTVATTTTNYWTGAVNTIEPLDIGTTYPDAVIEYVLECINKQGNEGIKQFTQGSVNGTYGNELSDTVKALLPVPYVKFVKTTSTLNGVIIP